MGTRNLTAGMIDGEYKVAQYGQWDGYPSGQGITALKFLRSANIDEFKAKVKQTRFLTKEDGERIDKEYGDKWQKHYPQLSRDSGAGILSLVNGGVTELQNTIGFAGDSLMCEYAYVVDLDNNEFEIYEGFNQSPITEGRFISGDKGLEKSNGYEPVVLIKKYSIGDLPSDEEFLNDLNPSEED